MTLHAQYDDFHFTHLTGKEGFTEAIAFDFLMDSRGYIWTGALDGLYRWDGSHFKVFNMVRGDFTTLGGDTILDLEEDADSIIWIASVGGSLNYYDPKTEQFKAYFSDDQDLTTISGQLATSLLLDDDQKHIWVGTFTKGFNKFDKETETFQHFNLAENFSTGDDLFKRNSVSDIIQDISNPAILWIAGNNGLYRFNKQSEQLDYFPSTMPNTAGTSVQELYMDKPGEIWMATYGMGIVRFEESTGEWNYYQKKEWQNNGNINGIFTGLTKKSDTEFWVASHDLGFGVFNRVNGTYYFFKPDYQKAYSILDKTASKVYVDKNNNVWISHHGKGASIFSGQSSLFSRHEVRIGSCEIEGGINEMASFDFDQRTNRLYVAGASCDPFYIFDQNKRLLQKIRVENYENAYQILTAVKVDQRGNIWVGAKAIFNNDRGLYYPTLFQYDATKERLVPFQHPVISEKKIQQTSISSILEDNRGRLWMGSDPGGLLLIDGDIVELKNPLSSSEQPDAKFQINQLAMGSNDKIWIATQENGAYRYDIQKDAFELLTYDDPHQELGAINTIVEDQNGNLWLGHGSGIQMIKQPMTEEAEVISFTKKNMLPGGAIDKLLVDQDNNVWATTQKGLALYDRSSATFLVLDEYNGLTEKIFYNHGVKELPNGEILLGQNGFFYSFQPQQFFNNRRKPDMVFSYLNILDQAAELDKPINSLPKIQLDYSENFFTIGFSAIEFSQPDNIQYAYQLEGFDKNWNYVGNRNFANYTNVPEGNYIFSVKAANSGVWNEEGLQIPVRIAPPWYRTLWAYLAYFLFTALLGGLFFAYQRRRWQLKTQLQLKEQEASKLKELDLAKTRLYTNITHEFRTPLTVIKGMAEEIPDALDAKKLISRNSDHLLNLINQMLDLSKLESGNLRLNNIQGNIVNHVNYLVESFHSHAFSKKITLSFFSEQDSVMMDFDPEKLRQILSNLISNAVKFTEEYGKIIVKAKQEGEQFILSVKDTGVGIPPEKLKHIFDRFFQVDDSSTRKQEGTGIGLALVNELVHLKKGEIQVFSQPNEGTEFIIRLPITQLAPIEEDIDVPVFIPPGPSEEVSLSASMVNEDLPLLLIVEDSPDIVTYLKKCLQSFYQIQVAKNGQLGIEKALEIIPDIIISDVMMPIKNGIEVCNTLKSDQRTSHIPIILLTAKSDLEGKLEGLESGADAYLTKPFVKQELLIRLANLIKVKDRIVTKYKHIELTTVEAEQKTDDLEIQFLSKLDTVIRENLSNEDFKVNPHLCRAMTMSRPQLYRKLKALKDISPSDYIRIIRMKEAKQLLQETNLKIGDIADKVGFKDQSYFTKVFVSEFGKTPQDARSIANNY